MQRNRFFFIGIAIIVLGAAAAGFAWVHRPAPTEREFEITARQFAFDPPRITVNLGDTVILRVRSEDITHGVYIDGYGIDVKVPPQEEAEITFVANRPGKIRYRCSAICGPLHPFMVGEIIVRPNIPLAGSAFLAMVVGVVALGYAWWRKEA
ncbi:MAG: cupredoxin domain-containing protein [Armatimonadota bacterium]|nr:cupredoxin domain-containing protein [Armatimonadota bacterium]